MKYTHQPAVAAVAAQEAKVTLELTEHEAQSLRIVLNNASHLNDAMLTMQVGLNHYLPPIN